MVLPAGAAALVTDGHVGVTWGAGRGYWLQLWMVTWVAGSRRIGRCSSWSRGQVTG